VIPSLDRTITASRRDRVMAWRGHRVARSPDHATTALRSDCVTLLHDRGITELADDRVIRSRHRRATARSDHPVTC
jgi:hypothetical protein